MMFVAVTIVVALVCVTIAVIADVILFVKEVYFD